MSPHSPVWNQRLHIYIFSLNVLSKAFLNKNVLASFPDSIYIRSGFRVYLPRSCYELNHIPSAKFICETLTSNVAILGDRAFKEIITVK